MLVGVSKAALEACVRYLGVELAPLGIRVNARVGRAWSRPARSTTSRTARRCSPPAASARPRAGMLEPQDLANAVAFLASPEASMIVGQTLVVDGGFSLPA